MSKKGELIGIVEFKDIKVKIYYEPDTDKNIINPCWQMRNPDSCYQGVVFINPATGKISYPDDVVIPEQTDRDKELLPKFVITGYERIDDNFISLLLPKLEEGYKKRNRL